MVCAVEREHARADDLPGRETGIVHGECVGIAHHLEREVAPRDEPTIQRRQPRDRLPFAEAGEERVRVSLELRDRRGGTEWEGGNALVGHAPAPSATA